MFKYTHKISFNTYFFLNRHYFTFIDKPHNPLLNSGAIMSSALLLNLIHPEMLMSEKFDFVSDYLRKMAGGEYVR